MRIKKLRLKNIRSYVEGELVFPEGSSTLLSGNIGSGKSSILLAIDFSLFGLQRGELSGNALLRNGADSGEVELTLVIDDKEIVINRSLKRSSSSVSQDSGSISINGELKQLTTVELKQEVLSLLNYPAELLSKSKALIFRYTVYTPQEEMKLILLGDSEVRLNTLRKVFDIDKYKRVIENSAFISTYLREQKKELTGKVSDLPVKQQELVTRESEVIRLSQERETLQPQINTLDSSLKLKEVELKLAEESMAKVREVKAVFNQCNFELNQFLQQKTKVDSDLTNLEQELASFVVPEVIDVSLVASQLAEIDSHINQHDFQSKEFSNKVQDARTKVAIAQSLVSQISQLSECPTCRQDVSLDYKKSIVARENANMASLNNDIVTVTKSMEDHSLNITSLKQRRESLVKSSHEAELVKVKLNSFNDKKLLQESLKKQQLDFANKIAELTIKKEEVSKLITDDDESKVQLLKQEYQQLQMKEKELVIKKASMDTSIKAVTESIEYLRNEIDAKKKCSVRIDFLTSLRSWVNDSFATMVESMERSVMMRVHSEFNDLFSNWFKMLVDTEDFSVRLDDEFTPVIEQNGYDIEYQYLSGGEKTAAALAYRLALNQVTNGLVSTIKTKDLLILDEPTDGFSADQLDHMRTVLEELNMGQIIIVSHEAKIESMVDKVIKFTKVAGKTIIT